MDREHIVSLIEKILDALLALTKIDENSRPAAAAAAFLSAMEPLETLVKAPPKQIHVKTRGKLLVVFESMSPLRDFSQAFVAPNSDVVDLERLAREIRHLAEYLDPYLRPVADYYKRRVDAQYTAKGAPPPRSKVSRYKTADSMGWLTDTELEKSIDRLPEPLIAVPSRKRTPKQKIAATATNVYFGTTRKVNPKIESCPPSDAFLPGRGELELALGVATVTIPPGHRIGDLEQPLGIWKFRLRNNSEKHVVLQSVVKLEAKEWTQSVRAELVKGERPSAFVFIHGFNVSYEMAMMRAAQIARDIAYEGLVTAFSWGSEGSILGYMADEINVQLAVPALSQFFALLENQVGVSEFHVVGHSMGCRALLGALQHATHWTGNSTPLAEVVFAAPDVDAQLYRLAVPTLSGRAKRYTLYSSARDWALAFSRSIRTNYVRAGEGGSNVLVVVGVETVDATNVGEHMFGLGHSYIADKRSVLGDLWSVFRGILMPRLRMTQKSHAAGIYWELQP